MAHENEAEIRRLYERYKPQWMLYHELSLLRLEDRPDPYCNHITPFKAGADMTAPANFEGVLRL